MRISHLILFILIGFLCNVTFAQTNYTERLISFDSDIIINEDASMEVIEEIQVFANGNKIKRGIYRDFPTDYKDDYGNNIRIKFDVIEVLRDGIRESYHTERLSNGIRVYAGRSDYFLPPGEYTYSIKYRTNRQIGYFDKFDELYWNVTGNGWDFKIEKVSATVSLPSMVSRDDLNLFGYTGYSGSRGTNYTARVLNSQTVQFNSNSALNPREGLTIVIQFPKGIVYEPSQSEKVNYFIQDNRQSFIGIIGILILILFYSAIWWRVGKDPAKGLIIPLFDPPDNMSPAAVRFITEMGYDNKTFTSTIVSLAVKGYLKIEEDDKDYLLKNSISNQKLTSDEQVVYDKLGFVNNGGTTLKLEQKNHAILQRAIKGLKKSLKNSFEKRYFLTNRKYFVVGLILSVVILLISNLGGSAEQIFSIVWVSFWSVGVAALLFAVFRAWKGALNKGRGKVTALGGAIFITLFSVPFVIGEFVGFYFLAETGSPLMIVIVGLVVFMLVGNINPELQTILVYVLLAITLLYGVLFVMPIGGADMPVVISLLNSFTGIAAAMAGFIYQNQAMILGGIFVGSAGTILTVLMCQAMNRSLLNVIIGAFGGGGAAADTAAGTMKEISSSDTAVLLSYSQKVVIVPGYGLAVAQAQHACNEMALLLEEKGVEVKYAIHPVAGRMPGHMNMVWNCISTYVG